MFCLDPNPTTLKLHSVIGRAVFEIWQLYFRKACRITNILPPNNQVVPICSIFRGYFPTFLGWFFLILSPVLIYGFLYKSERDEHSFVRMNDHLIKLGTKNVCLQL